MRRVHFEEDTFFNWNTDKMMPGTKELFFKGNASSCSTSSTPIAIMNILFFPGSRSKRLFSPCQRTNQAETRRRFNPQKI